MIIDYLELFTSKDGQAITGAAASDFRIDFQQEAPTTGADCARPEAVFVVKEDVKGSLTVSLQDSESETSGYANVATATTVSAPAAGTVIRVPVPVHHKRYLQAYFGGSPTAGKVVAFITSGVQDNAGFEQAASIHTMS